ncbi:penicillin-binding protein, 1A family [Alkaliphilus metalliredigens QYMF]|uniref:Penicillin-binding protein 1A n=1 Tax=Alkaliphilus metalliredigens (strain QYMF) TaxID=293826 RepID=A6TQ74_ALKMQ|nr:PBP1A family penicillin-binding protein [Alkaliphilus metalliredigens]ABR48342.1 penicillin-binding protein, 1A family [Alkaliphilus metalliredigens QYMF]
MKLQLNKRRILKGIFIFAAVFMVIMVMILTILVVGAYQEDLSQLEDPLPKALIIFDKEEEVVSERSSAQFNPVPLSQIPEELLAAIVAVEDQRFYDHSGVDLRGIVRSAWRNMRAGSIVEGGSTLTQQLAKNLFLTSERTYTRKFKEVITAYRIEGQYSKEDILELYLNQIYFGEGTWGIQNAAQIYFGKDIEEITLSEAALLAALPKAPTHYSPFKNEEKAKERRNLVLYLLHDQNVIDENEYDSAVNEEIILRDWELDVLRGKYPSYVDHVIEEAIHKHGFDEEYLLTGGLHIYTQMDVVVQTAIETTYENEALFPENSGDEIVQSATVVMDPSNGGIRGLVGYRGEHFHRGYNRATQLKRQPGSSIKPLAVYAPALENGYKPDSMLIDEKTDFNGYAPRNYNDSYQGSVSLSDALVYSINVPAVALLHEIGIDTGIGFLEKSGIPMHQDDRNLSIALGGFTERVSPLEMAQAFSMFPNLGSMNQAHAITRITSSTGKVLFEVVEKAVDVMKPENAYRMTQMLMGVVQEGTGKNTASHQSLGSNMTLIL